MRPMSHTRWMMALANLTSASGSTTRRIKARLSTNSSACILTRENQFVRVLGEIKSFNNKRSVTAASISRLEDGNEYLYHQLDVIYTHLQLTKGGSVRGLANAVDQALGRWPRSVRVRRHVGRCGGQHVDGPVAPHAAPAPYLPGDRRRGARLAGRRGRRADPCAEQEHGSCAGAVRAISDSRDAIDELANDGYIYQASDETHYLTTAG